MVLAAQAHKRIRQRIAGHRKRSRLLTRAAQHGRSEGFTVFRNVLARDEAAHGMPEHHIRNLAAETRLHNASQGMHVLHQNLSAVARRHMAQILFAGNAFAVAHMVVRAHHKAALYKELGEMGIPFDML